MEDRLWNIVVSVLPPDKPASRQTYSEREILFVVLWAALHDRPVAWACCRENWPVRCRPVRLPHPSTVSRRVRRLDFLATFSFAHQRIRTVLGPASTVAMIDGKPLRVSDYSRDPEARNGRAYRGFGKGYKLHAVIDLRGVVLAFEVQPLNVNERRPAARLLNQLPKEVRRVLGDGNYDSSPLHRQLTGSGTHFYSPPINGVAGPRAHRRRKLLARLYRRDWGVRLMNERESIERAFARMSNQACGLKELPNWVRRHRRVHRWISAKVLLHHAYLIHKQQPL